MRTIPEILDRIAKRDDCTIHVPAAIPSLNAAHVLPDDLKTFYQYCGGITLFIDAIYPFSISSPDQLVLTNDVLFKNAQPQAIEATKGHPSWSWYIIAQHQNSVYISVDMDQSNLGICYNSEWLLHPGNSYPIANSFSELLAIMLESNGETEFWIK